MIRAMIVDDQQDIRTLLRVVIEVANDGLEVGCEAASGAEAIAKVDHCEPNVVVLDEMMPGMNGVETAGRLAALRPDLRMILCSAYLDADITARARASGVRACVHKDELTTVPAVIREVMALP